LGDGDEKNEGGEEEEAQAERFGRRCGTVVWVWGDWWQAGWNGHLDSLWQRVRFGPMSFNYSAN
jgi:hypothetical protein